MLNDRKHRIGAIALALAAGAGGEALPAQGAAPALRVEAQTDSMIWNAVAVDAGRVFVSGPRWAGGGGPQVARVEGAGLVPYPDAAWNSWTPGEDAARKFVNVNALHMDDSGGLWVVDSGSPQFGGDPLPGGAKIVRIDLETGRVSRVIGFPADVAKPGSYVDDVRFNGDHAYLTDAGNPGIIVLDMKTGASRRVLDDHPSTIAPGDRPIVVDGAILRGPDGKPLRVNSDPMELSPDAKWLFYGPLTGPWSRIPTHILDDAALDAGSLAAAVEPFADLPPTGGSVIDAAGNLYFSDLKDDAVRRRAVDGTITTIAQDPRLHWVDAMFIDRDGRLWMPAAQVDRVALFHQGQAKVALPVGLYSLSLGLKP